MPGVRLVVLSVLVVSCGEHSSASSGQKAAQPAPAIAVADNVLIVPGERVGEFVIGRENVKAIWEYKGRKTEEKYHQYVRGLGDFTLPRADGVPLGELQFEVDSNWVLHAIVVQSAEYITAEGLRVGALATDVEAALGRPRAYVTEQLGGFDVQVLDYGGIVFSTDNGRVTGIRVRQS